METILSCVKDKKFWVIVAALIVLIFAYNFYQTPSKHSTVPVSVVSVIEKDIVPNIQAVGSITAENTVNIKPQVTGIITNIPVNNGQHVKTGDLLFVIDPRPFQASVDQAKATLLKDQATATNTQNDLARYAKLVKQHYVSKEFFDQTKSNAESAKAQVAADQAALKSAQLQLEYTQIRAPITGRLGNILPNVGDLASINDTTPLVTINQFSPIQASFSVPASNLPGILAAQKQGPLNVTAVPDIDQSVHAKGILSFIDNQITTSTGTVAMLADYPNTDEKLWPGEFVHVYLSLPTIPHALLVPTIAVQQDQKQSYYVYTIDDHHHAHRQEVTIGTTQDDLTQILSGLKLGDKVVTQGQFQIMDKSLVKIE